MDQPKSTTTTRNGHEADLPKDTSPPPHAKEMDEEVVADGVVKPQVVSYQPETSRLLADLALMAKKPREWLTRAIYQALLADPDTAGHLTALWLRTLARRVDGPPVHPADLIKYLAGAQAMPCLRHHRVGGRERHLAHFFPFGCSGMGRWLHVPLNCVDPRILRAVALLLAAFTQIEENPVFGFVTFSGFQYTTEAQRKLDQVRPIMVASAVRAIVAQIRIEASWSLRVKAGLDRPDLSRRALDRYVFSRRPSYAAALVERALVRDLATQIKSIDLGRAAASFVLQGERIESSPDDGRTIRLAALPTSDKFRAFFFGAPSSYSRVE